MSQPQDNPDGLPIIYMTHTGYAGGLRTSSRQFDGPASKRAGKDFLTKRGMTGGSLLAQGFNGAWCEALNKQEEGENIKYFAMLHDDVVPPDWWLDTLWEDLESSGADLMAAVVPIKDMFGNTSTAIDSTGDRFSVERRIHLAEIQRLPKVFSAADCNYPGRFLLANTGCWICRLDRPWKDAVDEHGNKVAFFTVNDKICRSPTTGKWICPVEPEDWFFSRQLGSLGAKVLCTSRMIIQHYGLMPFSSAGNWSQEDYDIAHGDRVGYQMIGSDKPKANMSYDSVELADVTGWLNDDEGRLLSELAEDKNVLEIGSYCGRSTIWLARTAKLVLAVDTFDGRGTPNPRDTRAILGANLERHGVSEKVQVMGSLTTDMVFNIHGDPDVCQEFDLIFIDGAHDYPSVVQDLEQCLQVLAPGGLIAFHDYDRPTDPGVTKLVDEQIKAGAEIVNRAGTVIVLKVQHGRQGQEGLDNGTIDRCEPVSPSA